MGQQGYDKMDLDIQSSFDPTSQLIMQIAHNNVGLNGEPNPLFKKLGYFSLDENV